eukprot:SAG31_NODE_13368_length_874_cov_1.260645_1_plen_245_part_10
MYAKLYERSYDTYSYSSLRNGMFLLPQGADLPRFYGRNYGSCAQAETEIDAEIARLRDKGVIDEWATVAREFNHAPEDLQLIMSLGVVLKRGKTRLVVDASRPEGEGRSLNAVAELPVTRLANIGMAMRAFSATGKFWLADQEDAFHQQPLAPDSTRFAGIRWRGVTYVYKRSFFGFAPAPSYQQLQAVALCRITIRRLRRLGLPCGDPPGWNQRLASSHPDAPSTLQRGLLASDQPEHVGPSCY